ncbi:MAG: DNA recombination protein RmuC [Bacteroidales bacterium]|nr:DNA recombination protein RmuC [Bacteroidales bacterium]
MTILLVAVVVALVFMCMRYAGVRAEAARLQATLDAERAATERRIDDIRQSCEKRVEAERESAGERFKALAADILHANSQQLDERSRMSLEAVLAPMKSSLETFTKDFKDCYSTEHTDRLSLREGIENLMRLNLRVSDEARNLTQALKGNNRWQGQWGEMVLKNILENSGLEEGRWLVMQESSTDEDGERIRPDAVIHCPQDRRIIIDSKASLTSYLQLQSASDDTARAALIKAHVRSIANHVKELRDKGYQDRIGLNKADFMLMFVPHEGAYIAAMNADPDLWQSAWKSRVIIVSPTHLVTVIKLVEQMWQTDAQNVNTQRIADEASKLIDKLAGFLGDLAKIDDGLNKARDAYDAAINKLSTGRGNILGRADQLRALGVRAGKPFPARFDRDE